MPKPPLLSREMLRQILIEASQQEIGMELEFSGSRKQLEKLIYEAKNELDLKDVVVINPDNGKPNTIWLAKRHQEGLEEHI